MQQTSKLTHPHRKIPPIWIVTWVSLFVLMLILSLIAPNGNFVTFVKLGGIVLCLFYVARTYPHDYFLLAAMLMTCLADIILAANNIASTGIVVFLIAQLLHLYRLNGQRLKRSIFLFTIIATILLLLDYLLEFVPLLFLASALYATVLATNIITCASWVRREPENLRAKVALAGFIAFACCDFCTGISYLSLTAILPAFFYAPANLIVWLFYYPSQVLLSNTGQVRPRNTVKH